MRCETDGEVGLSRDSLPTPAEAPVEAELATEPTFAADLPQDEAALEMQRVKQVGVAPDRGSAHGCENGQPTVAHAASAVEDGVPQSSAASGVSFWRRLGAMVRGIDDFLGTGEKAGVEAESPAAGGLRTILFTDVEGSTALTQRLGDGKAREVLRQHERIVRKALKSYDGSEVKTTGDGFMASFSSVTRALECAIAMQRAFAEHNETAQEPIRMRVGLNAGEPIAEDKDLFGTAVQLAARICAHADPGEILTSDLVKGLAAGKEFLFVDRGDVALRGFEDPVRLYEVRWR